MPTQGALLLFFYMSFDVFVKCFKMNAVYLQYLFSLRNLFKIFVKNTRYSVNEMQPFLNDGIFLKRLWTFYFIYWAVIFNQNYKLLIVCIREWV